MRTPTLADALEKQTEKNERLCQKDLTKFAIETGTEIKSAEMGVNSGDGSGILVVVVGLGVTWGTMGDVIGMTKDAMMPRMNMGRCDDDICGN